MCMAVSAGSGAWCEVRMKILIETDCTHFSEQPFEWDTIRNLKIPCFAYPHGDPKAEHGFVMQPFFEALEATSEQMLTGIAVCEACDAQTRFTLKKL